MLSKMYDLFRNIYSDLMGMQEKRRVDLKIVPNLNSLAKEYMKIERFWVSKDIGVNTAFPAFHAARNSRIILEKIIGRFEKQSEDENPRIVSETQQIFPVLLEVFSRLRKLRELLPNVEFDMSRQLFEVTVKLRNIASKVGMLPSLADELKSVNKEVMKEEFESLRRHWMLEILER